MRLRPESSGTGSSEGETWTQCGAKPCEGSGAAGEADAPATPPGSSPAGLRLQLLHPILAQNWGQRVVDGATWRVETIAGRTRGAEESWAVCPGAGGKEPPEALPHLPSPVPRGQ